MRARTGGEELKLGAGGSGGARNYNQEGMGTTGESPHLPHPHHNRHLANRMRMEQGPLSHTNPPAPVASAEPAAPFQALCPQGQDVGTPGTDKP